MMHAGGAVYPSSPAMNTPTANTITVAGNVSAGGYKSGAAVGVSANIVIPAVATITVTNGIITNVA